MHTNVKIFDFSIFKDFIRNISFDDISLKQAIDKQDEMEFLIINPGAYKPRNPEKIESRKKVFKNTKIFYEGRNLVVFLFEEGIFPLPKESHYKKPSDKTNDETGDETNDETDDERDDKQPDITDMLALESEEAIAQRRNQEGRGLKILTTNQMFSRSPITLAQLKAGNN